MMKPIINCMYPTRDPVSSGFITFRFSLWSCFCYYDKGEAVKNGMLPDITRFYSHAGHINHVTTDGFYIWV
jgi:hypothetical protein